MSNKEKQTVSSNAFAPAGVYDEENQPVFDADYWASFTKENVAPVSDDEQTKTDERQKEIEKLYPEFTRQMIDLEKLTPAKDDWNFFTAHTDAGTYNELKKNIAAYGQLSPALVWQQKDGTYTILGGNTRYKAIKELHDTFLADNAIELADKFSKMDCNVYAYNELDEVDARKLLIYDNIIRRENTTAIKVQAIIRMNQLESVTREKRRKNVYRERALTKIANILGENESTVKRLYRLRKLIPDFYPLVDARTDESVTNQYALAIAEMPADLQKFIFLKKLYKKKKLTTDELKKLKNAKLEQEVLAIYSAKQKYSMTAKLILDEPLPNNYSSIVLPVLDSEKEVLKNILLKAICNNNQISDKTKK